MDTHEYDFIANNFYFRSTEVFEGSDTCDASAVEHVPCISKEMHC